ncbi:acyl-CoA dehydrogenase family protein [Streptomyces rugosispiralis]|uniref:Acyl-CoA dehydrogenase family protein n=1 Tax=Streptomyces rugosispiralis TaxID=2967341 RepID=A0ABT1US30_9ACTN|nr:acyl-CoA dehydrogenase family protein [Streptomyces rugosispiralis]MCQ8187618.1 acyl-CoA dehydrogenase family protein [Streptomyces rugosispiralis]
MSDASPALEAAVAEFRAIFERLEAEAGVRDQSRKHPYESVRELADAGFGRLRVPIAQGGFGVGLPTLFRLLAEAGKADSNVPQILRGHFTTVEILRHADDPEAGDHWLREIARGAVFGNAQSEAAGASPDFGISTRVHEVDGRKVVSGTKYYSTGSLFADHIRVAVADDDGNRWFAVVPARHPGVTHAEDWDGIGQRLTGSGTTVFDRVPVERNGELGRFRENLRSLPSFVQLVHLANLAGIAHSLVDETVAVVRSRARTSLHALAERATQDPEVLGVVGRLHTHALTVDSLLRAVAEGLEAADRDGSEEAYAANYVDVSAAQTAIVEAVLDAGAIAFNAGGSTAVRESVHLDRHWRNARTLASHNPVIYKPRVVGDFIVNGVAPAWGYDRGRRSQEGQQR